MRVGQRSSTRSFESPNDLAQCTDLGSSCSALDSSERQQPVVRVARVQRSSSFRLLSEKMAKVLKATGLSEKDQSHSQTPTSAKLETSKPVRARLVRKKDNKGGQLSPIRSPKSGRRIGGRTKSFLRNSEGLDDSTLLDVKTPKHRSLTPTRFLRISLNDSDKVVIHADRRTPSRSSSLSPGKRISMRSISSCDRPRQSSFHQSCRTFQHERSVPSFESPRPAVLRKASAEYLKISQRNLTMQDCINEYAKISGEDLEV